MAWLYWRVMTLISSLCFHSEESVRPKGCTVVGWFMNKYYWWSIWRKVLLFCSVFLWAADKSPSWHLFTADSSAIRSCPYLRQWGWCWLKALSWALSPQKGTNLVGRKHHCDYLRERHNKNITLNDSLQFSSLPLKPMQTMLRQK